MLLVVRVVTARAAGSAARPLCKEASMSTITIYHNPACGTSRNVLGLIATAAKNRPSSNT